MHFKHTLSVFINKYNLIFKSIIFFSIIMLIMISLTFAFVSPLFKTVKQELNETNFWDTLKQAGKEFFQGDPNYEQTLDKLTIDWHQVLEAFKNSKLVLAIIVGGIFFLITKYLFTLSFFSYSDITNEFMLNNAKYGFLSNLISNLGRSAFYSLLYCAITIPFNAAIIGITYLIVWGLGKMISILFALPFAVIFVIITLALQNTILCCWLPAMTRDGSTVIKSINEAFNNIKPIFAQAFGLFVMINFLSLPWTFLCSVSTFGAGIFIAVPSIVIFKKSAELILYYNAKGYKYYIDKDNVVQGGL